MGDGRKTRTGCIRKHLKSEQVERHYRPKQKSVGEDVASLRGLLPLTRGRIFGREKALLLVCVHRAQGLRCKRCT